jgi:exoribonuclease-2
LRRYVDMVVHQQLRAWLLGGEPMDDRALMERVGAAGVVTGDVRYAERQSNRHWTMVYLQQNPDWTGEAIVVEQRGKQNIVLIPALAMDTKVQDRGGKRPLNSTLSLALKHVDLVQLEAKFEIK